MEIHTLCLDADFATVSRGYCGYCDGWLRSRKSTWVSALSHYLHNQDTSQELGRVPGSRKVCGSMVEHDNQCFTWFMATKQTVLSKIAYSPLGFLWILLVVWQSGPAKRKEKSSLIGNEVRIKFYFGV